MAKSAYDEIYGCFTDMVKRGYTFEDIEEAMAFAYDDVVAEARKLVNYFTATSTLNTASDGILDCGYQVEGYHLNELILAYFAQTYDLPLDKIVGSIDDARVMINTLLNGLATSLIELANTNTTYIPGRVKIGTILGSPIDSEDKNSSLDAKLQKFSDPYGEIYNVER